MRWAMLMELFGCFYKGHPTLDGFHRVNLYAIPIEVQFFTTLYVQIVFK